MVFLFTVTIALLFTITIVFLLTIGIVFQFTISSFSWWHHLAGLMIVACMSSIEESLGTLPWRKYKYKVDEFEALKCIRNAYVHIGSDLAKVRDTTCVQQVKQFLAKLKAGQSFQEEYDNNCISGHPPLSPR